MNYPESTTELDVCAGKCNRESQDEQAYWACIAECEAKQVALATDTEPDGGETEIWRGYFGSEDVALPVPYYQDESCTIYHGDCRELLPLVEAGVMVTDPPYGIGWSRGVNAARNSKPHLGIVNDEDTQARDEALRLCGSLPAIVFGSFYAPFPARLKQVLVWAKPADSGVVGSVTGFRRDAEPVFLVGDWPHRVVAWSGVLPSFAGGISAVAAETGHPHTKPIGLMRYLIERSPDGLILDPFMGSGTTLRAAKDLGRKAIGIEIEEKYCYIAAKRLEQSVLQFGDDQPVIESGVRHALF